MSFKRLLSIQQGLERIFCQRDWLLTWPHQGAVLQNNVPFQISNGPQLSLVKLRASLCFDIYHFSTCMNCVTWKSKKSNQDIQIMSLPTLVGRHIVFVLSLSVTQFVSATPLKLLNRISWSMVGSKDTIYSCAYYQEIVITWILWELCPFELKNFPKFTTEAACRHNSSKTTEQNFMKLGRYP